MNYYSQIVEGYSFTEKKRIPVRYTFYLQDITWPKESELNYMSSGYSYGVRIECTSKPRVLQPTAIQECIKRTPIGANAKTEQLYYIDISPKDKSPRGQEKLLNAFKYLYKKLKDNGYMDTKDNDPFAPENFSINDIRMNLQKNDSKDTFKKRNQTLKDPTEITSYDSYATALRKYKEGCSLPKCQISESRVFDDYYNTYVQRIKLYDPSDGMTDYYSLFHENRVRITLATLQYVGNTNPSNIKEHNQRIRNGLAEMISSGTYTERSDGYLRINENHDEWIVTWIKTTNSYGKQKYIIVMSPVAYESYFKNFITKLSRDSRTNLEFLH